MKNTGYIGLDVGTSGCKASVLGVDGSVLLTVRREYRFECPGKGMVELNPETVWSCVREVLSEIGAAGMEIRGISVSSIGEAMVMLDEQEQVLRNGITYLDARGPETVDWIREKISGRDAHFLTGLPMNLCWSLNRWLWLRAHEPKTLEKTKKVFLFGDYILYQLTGERLIDQSTASKTMLLDAWKTDWSQKLGGLFDVPLEKFSRVVPTGTVAGRLRRQIAQETGLPETAEVVVGCHDQCAATLGAGGLHPGDIMAGEGSSESINLIIAKENVTEEFLKYKICFEPYVRPEQYLVPVGQFAHGTAIRWFVQEFGADFGGSGSAISKERTAVMPGGARQAEKAGQNPYDLANANCAADAGDVYFLPYLTQSNMMDAENRALGTFFGLDVDTGRAKMYRALLEGLCFESRKSFDVLRESGLPVHKIVATGGCSRSELFMQMKADVLGRPIQILQNTDAGIMGLGMICSVADGTFSDYEEAAAVFARTAKEYQPERDYEEKYRSYRIICEAAKELYGRLYSLS